MTATLTDTDRAKISAYLDGRNIPAGLGTREAACSIAAINLALSGRLTDDIPACMSPVIGRWMIVVQDAMPEAMRNSDEWRRLIPMAAGTAAPEKETRRMEIILDWMWSVVLPIHQSEADARGYGGEWAAMCVGHSAPLAEAAAWAAREAEAEAARAARAATWATWAAWAEAEAEARAWEKFAPAALLKSLIAA